MPWRRIISILFWVQAGVNLVGTLGPEISFDSLWYHLPAARMLVERGIWGVIPGGLLYTTGLPHLITYANALLLAVGQWLSLASPEILPKLLSYVMGLLSAHMIYKIGRRYTSPDASWAAAAMWYASIVVGWQSMVVYVDLHRTFFTLVAVWFTLAVIEGERRYVSVKAGLMWGIAYSTKILAGVDLFFLTMALVFTHYRNYRALITIVGIAGIIASIWGALNVLQGYHFFYPMVGVSTPMPINFSLRESHLWSPFLLFVHPQHRTGPLLLILFLLGYRILRKIPRPLLIVACSLFISWWFAPATLWKGDGRYFLPALSVLSVLGAYVWNELTGVHKRIATLCILSQCVFGILYRGAANMKFVPYLVGYESKSEFLESHLNFSYGDWYDTDGWVTAHLRDTKYLVIGTHNTYYLPGERWEHESFSSSGVCYPYVLIQDESALPPTDSQTWTLVHSVERTKTKIYETHCL